MKTTNLGVTNLESISQFLVQHAKSLDGKDLRLVAQIGPQIALYSHAAGFIPASLVDVWMGIAKVNGLMMVWKVKNLEQYIVSYI
jgi:hypothetical protein